MKRLSLEMDSVAARRIIWLQNAFDAGPVELSHVVRLALNLLERTLKHQKAGGEVIFRDQDGSEKLVEIE